MRVRRLLDDFDQRHQERVQAMSSYDKAGDSEPGLKQFADPRKVELELKDERDRERTSQALASEYGQEATQVKTQEQALQDFIAKRQKALDDLSKRANNSNRQDLELAAENLARQPGTEVQVREIRRRLSDAERNQKDLSVQGPQIQQEIAGAQGELKKVQALEQSLQQQAKAYATDATSARQNQLNLADRLEFYVVRAKAEDVLDQDHEATQAVHHLSPSPEVRETLASPMPSAKPNAQPDPQNPVPRNHPVGTPARIRRRRRPRSKQCGQTKRSLNSSAASTVARTLVAASVLLLTGSAGLAQTGASKPEELGKQRTALYLRATRAPLTDLESDINHVAVMSETCRTAITVPRRVVFPIKR